MDWSKSGVDIHNFIRGLDSSPGAWTVLDGTEVKLYKSAIWTDETPTGDQVTVDTLQTPAVVHDNGLLITCNDGLKVNTVLLIILLKILLLLHLTRH